MDDYNLETDAASRICSPWRRWAARLLDANLESLLIGILLCFVLGFLNLLNDDWLTNGGEYLLDIISCIIGVTVLDSAIYALFGNTLGKFLFGVRIVNAFGEKLTSDQYMKRNVRVLMEGLGLGIPLFIAIAQLVQYFNVRKKQSTTYDRRFGTEAQTEPNHPAIKTCLGIIAFVGLRYFLTY